MTARLEQSSKRPYAASHGLSRLRQKQASAEYRNAQRGSYPTLPVKASGDTIFIQTLVFLMRKHNFSYILPFPQPESPDSAFFHSEAEGHGLSAKPDSSIAVFERGKPRLETQSDSIARHSSFEVDLASANLHRGVSRLSLSAS